MVLCYLFLVKSYFLCFHAGSIRKDLLYFFFQCFGPLGWLTELYDIAVAIIKSDSDLEGKNPSGVCLQ